MVNLIEYKNLDIELPDNYEQCLNWDSPTIIVGHPEEHLVEENKDILFPEQNDIPVVFFHEQLKDKGTTINQTIIILEPRKFKEKKQKYARDPKKLHATYQEEWDRLEKLSERTNRKKTTWHSLSPGPLLQSINSSNENLYKSKTSYSKA